MDKSKIELIRRECEQLFLNIAWLTDHGPHQDIAMLFTEDGEFDRDGVRIKGRVELIDLYAKRPISIMTRHLVSNLNVIPLSDEQATCRAYVTIYRYKSSDSSKPTLPLKCNGPEVVNEYEDQMVKTSDGWKVSQRVMKMMIQLNNQGNS
jgi:hypothetical protein